MTTVDLPERGILRLARLDRPAAAADGRLRQPTAGAERRSASALFGSIAADCLPPWRRCTCNTQSSPRARRPHGRWSRRAMRGACAASAWPTRWAVSRCSLPIRHARARCCRVRRPAATLFDWPISLAAHWDGLDPSVTPNLADFMAQRATARDLYQSTLSPAATAPRPELAVRQIPDRSNSADARGSVVAA